VAGLRVLHISKFNPKEDPAKVNDHGMDMLRYLIYSLKVAYQVVGGIESGTVEQQRNLAAASGRTGSIVQYGSSPVRGYGASSRPSWRNLN
jgi:hypothetical protein